MPRQPHASDWDVFFSAHPPRRKGPIALFVTMTLVLCFITVLLVGANFGKQRYDVYLAGQALTATPLWKEYYIQQTATARAQAVTPTPEATAVSTVRVSNGGNVRSEPRIAPETVVGQVASGDTVTILESRNQSDGLWHRVQVVTTAGALKPNTEGWISDTLLRP